jgi:hypothetical protein
LLFRALKEYLTDNQITKHVVEHESCNTKLINKRDVLTLDDCFNLFTKKEEITFKLIGDVLKSFNDGDFIKIDGSLLMLSKSQKAIIKFSKV